MRAQVTYLEYDPSIICYFVSFQARGDSRTFYMVKDFVKSFGIPSAVFVKEHVFQSGALSACWKVTPAVLERIAPAFTNLEDIYEEEIGESWGQFLRRDERILGIKFSTSARAKLAEEYQAAWERFQEEWKPDYTSYNRRRASGGATGKARQEQPKGRPQGTKSYKSTAQAEREAKAEAARQAEEIHRKQQEEEDRKAREQAERDREERRRKQEEAQKQNTRESSTFVRVDVPTTVTHAAIVLGLPAALFSLTKEQVNDAYRKLSRQYHPESHVGAGAAKIAECEQQIRKLNVARDLLIKFIRQMHAA